jgi:hypothetical protein
MYRFILIFFISIYSEFAFPQKLDSMLSSVYFKNPVPALDNNGFKTYSFYKPTNSTWAIDSFTEEMVYHIGLEYNKPLDTFKSYQLGIGKGGQIFSFKGAFGESIPPQFRGSAPSTYGGGTSYAPWVDEVWQMVAVDGKKNKTPDSSYFIHQSGVYLKTPEQKIPFYSPIIAEYYDSSSNSYQVVNWGQQAHTEDNERTGFTSSLLYYTTYSQLGNGIIAVDNMMYNFGEDTLTFLNVPWGGVRTSNLSSFFISTAQDQYNNSPGFYGSSPVVPTNTTGGWVAWSTTQLGIGATLAQVHPVQTDLSNSVFRYGEARSPSSTTNPRDYFVFEMIRFANNAQLVKGRCLNFRYYYVLGSSVDDVKSSILNNKLKTFAYDSVYTAPKNQVDSVYYDFQYQNNLISPLVANFGLKLTTQPYLNSYPVFNIQSDSNSNYIGTDLYHFSDKAYDGITTSIKLLGFRDKPSVFTLVIDSICKGSVYTFPDGSRLTIDSDISNWSIVPSQNPNWDSIILTKIIVTETDLSIRVDSAETLIANQNNAEYQWLNCDSAYKIVQGATAKEFKPGDSGNYAVEITYLGCIDTSECKNIQIETITLNNLVGESSLFPNPGHGNFTLTFHHEQHIINMKIYNITGVQMVDKTFQNTNKITLQNQLPQGVYFIHLDNGLEYAYLKWISL